MVEILRRGMKPSEKMYTVTCGNCGSKLRFRASEGQYISDQRDGDAYKITCPVCLEEVWTAV